MSADSIDKAEKFLAIASQFRLGSLVTESSHPATGNLSELAKNNLPEAISILKDLDRKTIFVLSEKIKEIFHLKDIINDTLKTGNNVFFCGCGATGRLSLTIETLWRQVYDKDKIKDRVFSFMAGGDVALIRSIENFEDFPHYGARQLLEAGFKDGDLLIGTTEGGETPFVIGAVEKAVQISKRKPFFMYCNPDNILCEVAERSRLVIQNPGIEKINLTVGPMAVTGSTRMQSSTILLAVAGIALFYHDDSDEIIEKEIDTFIDFWNSSDIGFIEKFIIQESGYYKNGEYLLYETDEKLGITVLTDTTERSPTFSLFPFENSNEDEQNLSLCYLFMPDTPDSKKAWDTLLWRSPRTLEWHEINGIASRERLLGFDFSSGVFARREKLLKCKRQQSFKILSDKSGISFNLGNESHFLVTPFSTPLFNHLVLKMILNTSSTLIMGRLGRYEGNVMTYVRASNNKLIDRAIRYVDMIVKSKNVALTYSEICYILFEIMEKIPTDESIVLATVEEIEKRNK
ncbi:MAG: SIS domain-containing protein [Bacteroidetes bacterium]|nr:MAG: SIS domain-containing protein [Bacteroidota bacterium]